MMAAGGDAQCQSILDLKLYGGDSKASVDRTFLSERSGLSKKRIPPLKYVKTELILSPFIGASLPLNELKGDLSNVSLQNAATSARSYYEQYGYYAGITAKLPVGKTRNIRPKITAVYNVFLNSGNDSAGAYTIEPSLKIFQIALGVEYLLLSEGNFMPFLEADIMANIFTGTIDFTNNESGLGFALNYNRNVRYGISAGLGVEYSINKNYSLLGGVKYNLANLIGREFDATGAHDLNDAAFTHSGFSIDAKTISFVTVYFGAALNIRD